jgi:hypothetical protein
MSSASYSSLPPIVKSKAMGSPKRNASQQLMHENPFLLPNDDQIFQLREEEKLKKQRQREENLKLKVWEKSNPEVLSRAQRIKDLVGETKVSTLLDAKTDQHEIKPSLIRHQEKENMTEFIAKKKEMFLVQMSLDTKREEIRKLEEKAQMKEEALQRSEQMLEEDAMRFDAFLKENDKKAHEAIKRAEEETKKKQDKTQEIKRLNQQIQALNSEMSKHKEALEDCIRYKEFLDMLTPPEWFENHRKAEQEKRDKIKYENYTAKLKKWERLRRKLYEGFKRDLEMKKEKNKRSSLILSSINSVSSNQDENENDEENWEAKVNLPPAPRLEEEVVDIPDEDVPMYFREPQQLMDIFSALEEQNLFLIQNSQETERSLEELQHLYRETRCTMDSKTSQLASQISDLKNQISQEEKKVTQLLSNRQAGNATPVAGSAAHANAINEALAQQTQQEKEKLLNSLNDKVRFVYERCGFDASTKPNTLLMLSQLETKLEELLSDIDILPVDYVIRAEKEKEKRRRERKREEQQALQEKKQEERNRNAIERSMKAPKKRVGRQVMYRSAPLRKENRHNGNDVDDNQDDDEAKYLS